MLPCNYTWLENKFNSPSSIPTHCPPRTLNHCFPSHSLCCSETGHFPPIDLRRSYRHALLKRFPQPGAPSSLISRRRNLSRLSTKSALLGGLPGFPSLFPELSQFSDPIFQEFIPFVLRWQGLGRSHCRDPVPRASLRIC